MSSQNFCVQSRSSFTDAGPLLMMGSSMEDTICHIESLSMCDSSRSTREGASRSGGASPRLRLLGLLLEGEGGTARGTVESFIK
jgi:hypothetical protein